MHDRAPSVHPVRPAAFDVDAVRRDFPILNRQIHGRPLVYLDNGATTQKPQAVVNAIVDFYTDHNANIHRGVHTLSQEATAMYEEARLKVARFLNAPEPAECIFVRGVTEGINLVAHSWARHALEAGDEVLLTALEHHSNIVPWQMVCDATGATLRVFPTNDRGELEMDRLGEFITDKTRLVAMGHVSNALGTIHDVETITAAAKQTTGGRALVLIDGAQWVAHHPTDVQKLGCDFYCFSGHKLFGPTGIGVLWGRRELLDAMPPFHGGGDMIESVSFEKTTYAAIPNKFEAGTPDIAGVIGLGAAIDYVTTLGFETFEAYEADLLAYATERLGSIPGLRIIGTAARKAGVISFVLEDPPISALDLGMGLDRLGIAVRTGHHCAQPLMDCFGITGTTRASFAFYNTRAEVDALVEGLLDIVTKVTSRIDQDKTHGPPASAGGNGADEDLTWPEPQGATPDEAAQELVDTFTFLTEAGEDPRDYVLELGRKIPFMPESQKNDITHVKGCMSQVWLTARHRPGTEDAIDILADSDAEIVKGLIGVLQHVFSGQSARKIVAFDIEALLRKLKFQQLISVQRRSGVEAMINRIRSLAKAMAKDAPHP